MPATELKSWLLGVASTVIAGLLLALIIAQVRMNYKVVALDVRVEHLEKQ